MRDTGPRPRKWVLILTLLLGVLTAVLAVTAMQIAERTFAGISGQVQAAMSVFTPLISILLVHDVRRVPDARLGPSLVVSTVTAVAVAVFGIAVSAAAVALAGPSGADAWGNAGLVALGSVIVQILASFVGTGLGLLLRWKVVAFLATIVFPPGVFYLLGAFDALRPAQPWLTPFSSFRPLLSGAMTATDWARWLVIALIWGLGLNFVGAVRWKASRREEVA